MTWKRALADLKQDLKREDLPVAPPPKPKTPPPPDTPPRSLDEEDAMFLAAMGHRAKVSAPATPHGVLPSWTPSQEPPLTTASDFEAAMGTLKGMKPLEKARTVPLPQPPAAAPQPPPETAPLATPLPSANPPKPEATAETAPVLNPVVLPRQIGLAAGMALDVDGMLDLRAHSREDALERLRERLQDGRHLKWRTLHLQLGPDPALHDMFQTFLQTEAAPLILQYAQAPIPMGGKQAWILYFPLS